jgi:hypothetical protein
MDIIKLTPETYKLWDEFCETSPDSWYWHTSDWLEYTQNYRPSLKSENHSFYFFQDKRIYCACPLFLEENEEFKIKEFSFGGDFLPNPFFAPGQTPKQRLKLEKKLYAHIEELAKENDVQRVRFRTEPLADRALAGTSNGSLHYGYFDNSQQTIILDLKPEFKTLKSNLRHGAKYSISVMNKKDVKFNIYTHENITDELFNGYQQMHLKAAGRVTRPQKTWDLMKEWVKEGKSFLISAVLKETEVGFSLFSHFRNKVYYSSAANDPDLAELPISHAILWEAIRWLNEKKFEYLEIGPYAYPSLHDMPSDKEMEIVKFKRGFGGKTYPKFRAEKYYSSELCKSIIEARVEKYINWQDKA